jgi:phosphoribosylamine--glycine ligase
MLRLKSDLLPLLLDAAQGDLSRVDLAWSGQTAVTVVMAAKGYPGEYEKGSVINGLNEAEAIEGVTVFHAGTTASASGEVQANGGRVLNVSAIGRDVAEAKSRAYAAVGRIDWPDGFCRSDIGLSGSQNAGGS